MDADFIIILVTTPNKQEAERIANHLIDDRLVACANIIGPVSSVFRWSEKIDRAEEFLMTMKSSRQLFERVTEVIKTMHSYEVPEILALPVTTGSKTYLEWLQSCLIK